MLRIQTAWLLIAVALLTPCIKAGPFPSPMVPDNYPRRTIAGVSVVDTPIVRAAQQLARDHGTDHVYRHIMRSWLFGTLMLQHNETLQATVDAEVHAVALILHDLGFDRTPNSTIFTLDHRFEVDGAIAARKFIREHRHGRRWEERRVQLVWDAIALHGETRIAFFKEQEVETVAKAVSLDFSGPGFGVPEDQYAAVLKEFSRDGFRDSVIETTSWLCRTKPETTYGKPTIAFTPILDPGYPFELTRRDNFLQPYGERFVPGYSAVGHRSIDGVLGL